MYKFLAILSSICASLALCGGLFASENSQKPENAEYAAVGPTGVFVDGKPFRLLSGEVHYFRIFPEYWKDSLEKLRACGLNTVSTYCPWNAHEPRRGEFDFSGILNLKEFLKTAQDLGLKVMLRPGPYICSEWDFGGLPWWLNNIDNIRLRSMNPQYMEAVRSYMKRILKEAEPYFCNNGGPIIAIQLENGYASYGNDANYIEALREMVLDSGFKGILYTSDGDSDTRIHATSAKGVWRTLMTGTKLADGIEIMNKSQPGMPQMISEYWVGQGLRLGKPMYKRDHEAMSKELDSVLAGGAHICCYMFHGGTNFGFMSGALRATPLTLPYTPFVSSYDVDALLSEAGDTTPKYYAFRKVFLKYNPDAAKYDVPANSEKRAYGEIKFTEAASMADNIENLSAKKVESPTTLTMEEMGHPYGFIHYRTRMSPQSFPMPVKIDGLRDRAWISMNGENLGVFTQNDKNTECVINIPPEGADIDILVENMGRVNFGLTIVDNKKGITGGLILNKNQQYQNGWTINSLPLNSLEGIKWNKAEKSIAYPAFFRGELKIDEPGHTYIKVNGTRGYIWINGFLLGRYDKLSPIATTYIPARLLKSGGNTIEILELESMNKLSAESTDKAEKIWREN